MFIGIHPTETKYEEYLGVPLVYQSFDFHMIMDAMRFQACQLLSTRQASRSVWIRKCDAELSGSSLPLVGVAHQQFVVVCC